MSPRAGDSHQVGGEFPKDHFNLLMRWFPLDVCEGGVRRLGLYTVGGNISDIVLGLDAVGKGPSLCMKSFDNVC